MSSCPATTCAFVTTSSLPATQPLPSTPRPQAVPSTFTTLRPAASTSGSRAIFGVRRRHVRRRAADRRERVEAGERLEDRPRRRQHRVELPQDRRALDGLAQVARARSLKRYRADDPHQEQPQAGEQRGAAHPVQHSELLRQPVAQLKAEHLEPRGQQRSEQQRPDQGEQRGVRRMRTVLEQERSEARADERPGGKARQRQASGDQPLAVAPDREEHGEGDDDPVEARQGPSSVVRAATIGAPPP